MPAGGHVNVALQVFRISQLVGDALDAALEPVELEGDTFAVLSVLRTVQPVRPAELAGVLKMPPTSLSSRLTKLENRKLIRRRPGKSDARARLLELTAQGERKLEACGPIFFAFVRAVEGRLGDRLLAVQDALADLEQVLEEYNAASDSGEPVSKRRTRAQR